MGSNRVTGRLAAGCGLLYPVLLIVGDDLIARGDEVASDAGTPYQVAAALAGKDTTAYYAGRSLGMVSLLCLLVFAAAVAVRLRRIMGPDSLLPQVALAGASVAAALQLGAAVFQMSLVKHGGEGLPPELVVLLLDFGGGFLVAMLPLSLLVAAVAVAGVRGELVNRFAGWSGAVLAVGLVVGFVAFNTGAELGFLAMPLTWLWCGVASVSMVVRTRRDASGAEAGLEVRVGAR
jgi:hypothetical protein